MEKLDKKIKIWKITKYISLIVLVVLLVLICVCMIALYYDAKSQTYPQMLLGFDAMNWMDYFNFHMYFVFYIFGLPLVIDLAFLIISIATLHKLNKKTA